MADNDNEAKRTKGAGKGWTRSLKTWLALSANPAQRSAFRNMLRQSTPGTDRIATGEFLVQQETVAMAKGVENKGQWWAPGNKRGSD